MDWYDGFQVVFLLAYAAVVVAKVRQMRARGINPLMPVSGKQWYESALQAVFFPMVLIWGVAILFYAFGASPPLMPDFAGAIWFSCPFFKGLGTLMILLGFGMLVWALLSFGESWRIGIDRSAPGSLVTNGAFSFSRNPIFLFLDLYVWGVFLVYTNLFFFLFALGLTLGTHRQILHEEEFLAEQYGWEYEEYNKRVRRYFGRS